MADAATLLAGGSRHAYILGFGSFCIVLQIHFSYARHFRALKWLPLSLFAYVGVVFSVDLPWLDVVKGVFVPSLSKSADYLTTVVAILGTTISPYLFFWQASQEGEDLRAVRTDKPLHNHPDQAARHLARIKLDTYVGMGFSNLIAFLLFSMGIIGTGLLAVPVPAGSAAFAVAESSRWRRGMDLTPVRGVRFYGVIAPATLVGVGLGFTQLDPVKALFYAAVIIGVISTPIMVVMMRMASNPKIMGQFVVTRRLRILGWAATTVMAVAVAGMFFQMLS